MNSLRVITFIGIVLSGSAGQLTNVGTEFVFTFLETGHEGGENLLWLIPASDVQVSVNITYEVTPGIPTTSQDVVPSEGKVLSLPGVPRAGAVTLSRSAVILQATSPVTAMVVTTDSPPGLHQEAALLLPVPALGLFHIVTPFFKVRTPIIAIVATQDNTRVRVFTYVTFSRTRFIADVRLQVGDVYIKNMRVALVTADAPVAVFCGSYRADDLNHMLEQSAPLQAWGKTHVAYFYDAQFIDWLLPQGFTACSRNGNGQSRNATRLLGYMGLSGTVSHQTDKPSVVIRIENPYNLTSTRPCRVDITPREQWLTDYKFYIGQGGTDIIVVVDNGDERYVRMNGHAISTNDCRYNGAGFKQCRLSNNPTGPYVFTSRKSKPMAVYLHREDETSAICVQAGAGLNVLNQEWVNPCPAFYAGTTSISGLEIPLETLCPVDPEPSTSSLEVLPSSTAPLLSSDVEVHGSLVSSSASPPASPSITVGLSSATSSPTSDMTLLSVASTTASVQVSESVFSPESASDSSVSDSPLGSTDASDVALSSSLHTGWISTLVDSRTSVLPTPVDERFAWRETTLVSLSESSQSSVAESSLARLAASPSPPSPYPGAASPSGCSGWEVTRVAVEADPVPVVCRCRSGSVHADLGNASANRDSSLASVLEGLQVDRKNTSLYRRRLVSIPDVRTSSRVIAGGGIAIMCSFIVTIVLPDVFTLLRYLKTKL